MHQSIYFSLAETPTTPTTEAVVTQARLSDRDRAIAIAVPTAVGGAILLVVVIIVIIVIVVKCRKKRHSQKYVLNYHTVYGKIEMIIYFCIECLNV